MALLADLTGATDEKLRELARRLAAQLFLDLAKRGPSSPRGVGQLRTQRYRPDGGDLDVDASLDAVVSARVAGTAVDPDDLRIRAWSKPGTAICLLVDRSGSMGGEPLATAAAGSGLRARSRVQRPRAPARPDRPPCRARPRPIPPARAQAGRRRAARSARRRPRGLQSGPETSRAVQGARRSPAARSAGCGARATRLRGTAVRTRATVQGCRAWRSASWQGGRPHRRDQVAGAAGSGHLSVRSRPRRARAERAVAARHASARRRQRHRPARPSALLRT